MTITARAPAQRRSRPTPVPHPMVAPEPARPRTLLDWGEDPDERGAWTGAAARAWAAVKLLMLAATLALGGTFAFVLAAVALYSGMGPTGP